MTHLCSYNLYSLDGSKKINIGEKENRICRFCGRSKPDVKFSSKAHAISEFLGNKQIICLEECNNCNDFFSSIEQHFFNFQSVLFPLYGIKGKTGTPKVKGSDGEIYNENEVVKLKTESRLEEYLTYDSNVPGTLKLEISPFGTFIPQKVYQCLVKYAISSINTESINQFKESIDWIRIEKPSLCDLPPVIYFTHDFIEHPKISVYIRNEDNDKCPFALGCLEFADKGFFYIIPLSNSESITIDKVKSFVFIFVQLFGKRDFQLLNLSDTNSQKLVFNLNTDNVIPGQTIFEISKDEFDKSNE
ncbi:MAG: hypothetical protein HDS23_05565 [Bacteroides sp.]|nr:hypothetical protein [Bacteroides sp.]